MIRDILSQIISFQPAWSSQNTLEMKDRGELVRRGLPTELRLDAAVFISQMGISPDDLLIEGRDGTGLKTAIPWVRFGSASRSPSAQEGWYCVYLFHSEGNGVYMALAHGSTRFQNGSFQPRSDEELLGLVTWARTVLADSGVNIDGLAPAIKLGSRSRMLGEAYERSTVFAKWYDRKHLPTEYELRKDAIRFARLLRELYDAQDKGLVPGEEAPEIRAVKEAANPRNKIRSASHAGGQGWGLTAPERAAVEAHAMDLAKRKLEESGYTVHDHSKTSCYDYLASREGREIFVEVKGTTAPLGKILLTVNEVAHHQEHYPNNALIIIHTIGLDRHMPTPRAYGGTLVTYQPWLLLTDALKPIAFEYNGLPPPN